MLTLVNDNGNWYYKIKDGLYYDSDRYELVEKKDWKINNLKEQIKGVEEALENNKKSLKFYQDLITMNLERIDELKKELKELEKE